MPPGGALDPFHAQAWWSFRLAQPWIVGPGLRRNTLRDRYGEETWREFTSFAAFAETFAPKSQNHAQNFVGGQCVCQVVHSGALRLLCESHVSVRDLEESVYQAAFKKVARAPDYGK
jgi:hypothetical protein